KGAGAFIPAFLANAATASAVQQSISLGCRRAGQTRPKTREFRIIGAARVAVADHVNQVVGGYNEQALLDGFVADGQDGVVDVLLASARLFGFFPLLGCFLFDRQNVATDDKA